MASDKPISETVTPRGEVTSEVEHLLEGVVGRKTNQGLILQYLARNHVRGEGPAKEHAIAVEALGRGVDFDPKREAIVRVEMHKLRRTLKAYYATSGHGRPVQLSLAAGKYALVVEGGEGGEAPPVEVEMPVEAPPSRRWIWGLAGLAGAVVVGFFLLRPGSGAETPPTVPEPAAVPAAGVRILAGGPNRRYVDSMGQEWTGDRFFARGRSASNGAVRIVNTTDQTLYSGQREGDFQYEIPLEPGDYEVRLHMAETHYGKDNLGGGGESSRRFQIFINSQQVERELDVLLAAGGPNQAVMRVYPGWQPEPDGKLRIRFESLGNDKAFVNAVEVVPGLKDRMLPMRIASGASQIAVDSSGRYWLPDRHVLGGRSVERVKPVAGGAPELYRFERFGRFEYALPAVAGHTYQVKMWFAEQYFGVLTGLANPRPRVFDVYCNGSALLRDFSVIEAAGGPGRGVERVFTHLVPDGQQNIRLLFAPRLNYAELNAIELIDEGPAR